MSACLDAFRSPADRKNYRLLTLANGLEALLVHSNPVDADADTGFEQQRDGQDDDGGRVSVSSSASLLSEPDEEPMMSSRVSTRRSRGVSVSSCRSSFDGDTSEAEDGENEDDQGEGEGGETRKRSHLAAACLTVSVGSMADPPEVRGLAHYLEHMLFMGSTKYPDENEFEAFLSTHGGYSNGATECETTRYLFEVGSSHLAPALDMFANFFVSPLLKKDAMERELRAVESEFNRAKNNDYVRLQQVQCETCAPGHPYDSFSWGNARSLFDIPQEKGVDVRATMQGFFDQHYSAHLMKLCVYGEQSLDDLEKMVVESFSAIPRRCVGSDGHDTRPMVLYDSISPAFGARAGQKPSVIKIIPVRKTHQLHLYWPLPTLQSQHQQKPWEYLAHILGHEGRGSVTTLLRSRQWATEVTAGISESDSYEFGSFGSLFEMNISLTRLGVKHWEDVVHIIYDSVAFLKNHKQLPAWIFDEIRTSTEMDFRFQEEMDPTSTCRRFSDIMQQRFCIDRPCGILRYGVLEGKYEEPQTRALLALMTPENSRVILLSHKFEDDGAELNKWLTERWCGAKYCVADISQHLLDRWNLPLADENKTNVPGDDVEMAMPARNPFMPQTFDIIPLDEEYGSDAEGLTAEGDLIVNASRKTAPPEVALTTARGSKLWYKRDATFLIPKTNANFLLCLPSITRSAINFVYAQLHLRAVYEDLKDVWYQADNAGLSFGFMVRDLDIELEVAGFSDKIPELVRVVTRALVESRVADVTAFNLLCDEMAREYRNVNLKPAAKARYLRLQLLERETFSIDDKLRALEQVSLDGLVEFQQSTLWKDGFELKRGSDPFTRQKMARMTVRALVHGNITRLDAKKLLVNVEDAIWMKKNTVADKQHDLLSPVLSPELPLVLSPLVTRLASPAEYSLIIPPSPPLTPVRPQTFQLPVTANGLLLRDMSEHDEETNSMVEVYFQLGRLDAEDRAYADLLQQLMAEPLFHELRTIQQLGYEVHCCVRDTHGVVGFSIAVQSASHPTGEIALCIDEFVTNQFPVYLDQELSASSTEDSIFARNVMSLQRSKTLPDGTLGIETSRYWEEIQARRYEFTLDQQVAEALGQCSVDGLLERYRRWLLPSAEKANCERKMLRVHIIGQRSPAVPLEQLVAEDEAPHIIDDLRAYKRVLRCHS